jgi:hypothetical protein
VESAADDSVAKGASTAVDAGGKTMNRSICVSAAALCAALSTFATADAASITAKLETFTGGTIKVQYTNPSNQTTTVNGGAGAFLWTLTKDDDNLLRHHQVNSQFITFCIEAVETVQVNKTYEYAVVNPREAPNEGWPRMTADRADLLSRWFGTYYLGSTLADWTATQAMAFQMGVWEIVAETSAYLDLQTGALQIKNQNQAKTLAQDWLNGTDWKLDTAPRLHLAALTAPWEGVSTQKLQDQIVVLPTPLAGVASLVLIGGLSLRRNRRRLD